MRYCKVRLLAVLLLLPGYGQAAEEMQMAQQLVSYPTAVAPAYPRSVFWGDTHLHSNLSFDAYLAGNTGLSPATAYRFAKGEPITVYNGLHVQLKRPLDFLVVADHASMMGGFSGLVEGAPSLLKTPLGRGFSEQFQRAFARQGIDPNAVTDTLRQFYEQGAATTLFSDMDFRQSIWQTVVETADRFNVPQQFTALIGYEWTAPFNLHRVVIFKGDAEDAAKATPLAAYWNLATDSNPETLWATMAEYEATTGDEVLAIPHNGNRSSGVMFALQDAQGQPLSERYAQTRSRWEPLYEVTQIKGDGETLPILSPNDEFADFERLTHTNQSYETTMDLRKKQQYSDYTAWYDERARATDNGDWMRPYEYARSALKLGLGQQASLGVNPFKFGLVGGSDAHTSLAAVAEDDFWGKMASTIPNPERLFKAPWGAKAEGWMMNAAGYTAVWAEENTREALFAAMKRKEVYASTGPRMTVRFFGGWDYQVEDAFKPNLAQIGYQKGVPMGGDLSTAPSGKVPRFLIRAVRDPQGANLDRIQVIKGWRDSKGELHEKIYNVALSDGRKENHQGKVKPVGTTVDIADASYTNTIGDPELATVWEDPDFDKGELAFYYLRVLEIPTPRWSAYDAKYFASPSLSEKVPMVIQERAYSSPIWFTP